MIKNLKKSVKPCCICGKPVSSNHSRFCRICSRLAFRMKIRRFPPQAVEGVWDQVRATGHRCYYTNMPLEMDDTKSPWFCVFDHLIPLDPRKIVLTSALFNGMKSALSEKEFWNIVEQLDDCKHKHKKFKKIRLAYWRHFFRRKGHGPGAGRRPISARPKVRGKKCCICGRPVFNVRSKYCLRCSRFAHRLELKGFALKTVAAIWDYVRKYGYVCYFTGLLLDMGNDRSPWYCDFNCLTPHDPSKVVLSCSLISEMKSDLSEKEFWYYIRQLANYKRKHAKIKKKKPVYWYRLTPQFP